MANKNIKVVIYRVSPLWKMTIVTLYFSIIALVLDYTKAVAVKSCRCSSPSTFAVFFASACGLQMIRVFRDCNFADFVLHVITSCKVGILLLAYYSELTLKFVSVEQVRLTVMLASLVKAEC